jgi:hypothetical protein
MFFMVLSFSLSFELFLSDVLAFYKFPFGGFN